MKNEELCETRSELLKKAGSFLWPFWKGDAGAQYELGTMYKYGLEVAKDGKLVFEVQV